MRDIAEAMAAGLELPILALSEADAPAYFGRLSTYARLSMQASNTWTRERLDWQPTGPGLVADFRAIHDLPAASAA